MRIKTIALVLLIFLLTLTIPMGYVNLNGIQRVSADNNTLNEQYDVDDISESNPLLLNPLFNAIENPIIGEDYPIQDVVLTLDKTADPMTYDAVGDEISYEYLLTNSGSDTLIAPFSVDDDKLSVTCPGTPTSLATGESITCTVTYTIQQADLDSGSVTNNATGHAYFDTTLVDSNADSATVTAAQTKTLNLTKNASPGTYNAVGNSITYSYVIKNTGNVTLTGTFSITDDKATVTCTQPVDGALSPNEQMNCTAAHIIVQADLDAGSVTNHATASGAGVTSNQATATVTAAQTKTLNLTKNASPGTYNAVGNSITYSYVIKNTGNVTLTGTFSITDDKATVTCTQPVDGALSPNEQMNCTATHIIVQADLDAGSVTNHATASGAGVTSNQATATVTAAQTKTLNLTKNATPSIYDHPGQWISYSFKVENTGNVTLSAPFAVFDDKTTNETCPPTPTSLNPGQFITCSASYTIMLSDMTSGSVTNSAYATGKFGGTTVTSNTDIENIFAEQTLTYNFIPITNLSRYGVLVLPSSYYYVSHETMFVIGEVLNNTTDSLTWVEIDINFYDSIGSFVGTSHTYLWPPDLPAWEKGCISFTMDVPPNWSYYKIESPTYTVGGTSSGLVIVDDSGFYNSTSKGYDITSHVRNDGNQRSTSVVVSGTLYNVSGVPVGCEHSTSTDLDPGLTSSFSINFLGYYRDYFDVVRYRLRVAGELP